MFSKFPDTKILLMGVYALGETVIEIIMTAVFAYVVGRIKEFKGYNYTQNQKYVTAYLKDQFPVKF